MSARFHPYLCGRNAAEWLIDMYDMGVNAARFVLQRIRKPNLRTQSYVTSPCILEREST